MYPSVTEMLRSAFPVRVRCLGVGRRPRWARSHSLMFGFGQCGEDLESESESESESGPLHAPGDVPFSNAFFCMDSEIREFEGEISMQAIFRNLDWKDVACRERKCREFQYMILKKKTPFEMCWRNTPANIQAALVENLNTGPSSSSSESELLRDRTTLPILKSTAYCISQNSHTRLALDHNSALLLLLQSHNLQHRRRLPY